MANQKICDRCGKPVADHKLPWLICLINLVTIVVIHLIE